MAVQFANKIGTIELANIVFCEAILNSMNKIDCKGKIWPSTDKGRLIGEPYLLEAEAIDSIVKSKLIDGSVELEFTAIIKFGSGIQTVTNSVCQYLFEIFKDEMYPISKIRIIVNGIKSIQIAKREIEVIKTYEPKR